MTRARKLEIYRANLARYDADGNEEQAAIERRLIARMEQT